jgi:hypothetical protein
MDDITAILKYLFAAYPNTTVSEQTVFVYMDQLQDIPVGQLGLVVKQCIADGGDFIPSVSAIRNKWLNLSDGIARPTPIEAWGMVRKAIASVGYVGTPTFDDEIVGMTVKQMGWRDICMSEKPDVIRAQFERMYQQNVGRTKERDALLPGVREAVIAGEISGPTHIGKLLEDLTSQG